MTIGSFLIIIALIAGLGTAILLAAVVPLLVEVRETVETVHHLLDRAEPNVTGLLQDANRIMDDAAVLSESLVKQKQSVDTALSAVGYALGHGYGLARRLLTEAWTGIKAGWRKVLQTSDDGGRRIGNGQ